MTTRRIATIHKNYFELVEVKHTDSEGARAETGSAATLDLESEGQVISLDINAVAELHQILGTWLATQKGGAS